MSFTNENSGEEYVFFAEDSNEETLGLAAEKQVNVMIVDDESEVHSVTHMVLSDYSFEGAHVNFIDAYSAEEARVQLSENEDIALILLDVVMEFDDSGLELVKYIRETLKNSTVRIILRTGQPGQAPEQSVIFDYDINDYKSKTELTSQKLVTVVTASLRNYRDLQIIQRDRLQIESNNRLNMKMLDSLPCAAMLVAADGKVILSNQTAIEKGFEIGLNFFYEYHHLDNCPWGLFPYKFNKDVSSRWETNSEGKYFDIFWTPLDDGQALFYAFDVTVRRKYEIEKQHYQKMFQQAQKMESIGLLASGIAHDFNNILTAINGCAELLALSLPDESEEKESVNFILDAGSSGTDLAQKLLSLSRKGNEEFVSTDVHSVIENVQALLLPNCKNIEIKTNLRADQSVISGDKSLLQNALINLGMNGRDAMPRGGVLTFSTSKVNLTDDDISYYAQNQIAGEYLKIEVSDTGTGIDPETIEHIFEPLYTTKDQGKGTGLGLANVYSCVQNHNGLIDVESVLGKGTKFTILLPL